jgi:hypothetical protein
MATRKGPLARKKVQLTVEEGTNKSPSARERPKLNMKTEDKYGNSLDYIKPSRPTRVGRKGVAYGGTAGVAANEVGDLTSQAMVVGEDGEYTAAAFDGVDLYLAQAFMDGHDEAGQFLNGFICSGDD